MDHLIIFSVALLAPKGSPGATHCFCRVQNVNVIIVRNRDVYVYRDDSLMSYAGAMTSRTKRQQAHIPL